MCGTPNLIFRNKVRRKTKVNVYKVPVLCSPCRSVVVPVNTGPGNHVLRGVKRFFEIKNVSK